MDLILQPVPNLRFRYCVLGLMLLPVIFASRLSWSQRLLALILPLMLTGTYRISKITADKFKSQLFIGFVPMKPARCKLPAIVFIETKYNSSSFFRETFWIFEPIRFLLLSIFDLLMPALGGAYEIWLITAKGREIVAWQGFGQKQFEDNLALLKGHSGAEVRGRSK